MEKERLKRFPIDRAYFQKLSAAYRLAYVEVVSKVPAVRPVLEYYYRCRLIQDYIGMTTFTHGMNIGVLMAVEQ